MPRREHARFCSARCRVAWNRQNIGERAAEMSALDWSITAMGEATTRLARVRPWEPARAWAAVSDAVWWVTIVDATVVRYYPEVYDGVLGCLPPAECRLVEDTLAGLRFVRNQMGAGDQPDFIRPESGSGCDQRPSGVTSWTWAPLPQPDLEALPSRGQAWELGRYQAYEVRLAGRPVGETFGRAAAFLRKAVEKIAASSDGDVTAVTEPAGRLG